MNRMYSTAYVTHRASAPEGTHVAIPRTRTSMDVVVNPVNGNSISDMVLTPFVPRMRRRGTRPLRSRNFTFIFVGRAH